MVIWKSHRSGGVSGRRRIGDMRQTLALILVAWCLAAPASAYEAVTVTGGGRVQGHVTFQGTPPPPHKIKVTKDHDTCGTGERLLDEVQISQGGLRNAVVYLEGIERGKGWENAPQGYLLDQRGCRFLPTMLVFPKGKELVIANSDPVAHNIHMYELRGRVRSSLFNTGQPLPGKIARPITPRKANALQVACDIHNFMQGGLFAAETPYYAVTNETGQFAIADIPPGQYKMKAWHPVLGTKEASVVVEAGKTVNLTIEWGTAR